MKKVMSLHISALIIAAIAAGSANLVWSFSFKQVVKDYKQNRETIKKKRAGKASAAELAALKQRRRNIMKAAIAGGAAAGFASAVGLGAYAKYKGKPAQAPTPGAPTPLYSEPAGPITEEQHEFEKLKQGAATFDPVSAAW